MSDLVEPKQVDVVYETDQPVLYEVIDGVAWVTMNRPDFNNAQNGQMTYALDDAFMRATNDDAVKCIVLAGNGKHFSAGHDIGTPGRDLYTQFENRLMVPPHVTRPGAELLYTREQEQYLGMCRRWRDIAKPTIAMVQGACIAGGLMLAWVCDLIVATDDAFFQDPVNRMGIPGVEYFAHAFELPPRVAKEFLLLGERMSAQRAEQFGMVNKIVSRAELRDTVAAMAAKLVAQPRLGNWLTKQAINHVEELRGKRSAMDAVFHMHHFAHAQNDLVLGNSIGGLDGKAMAAQNKQQAKEG
ncbi:MULTISPECIES: enoyl-CoA hydratase [Novosphingobium]|uniref:Enoyl-CoA hydratase n=1 Tax=Novosphingobium arvoryzae TaxID=1256514 RepID=A0A918VHS5_9SPHN|nr:MULTISPECIES: enoyl-CoA hydratase [Novosphingobium]QOV96440.1 enoyl-CoA hydratase [Novosphingobium sp. ES2-1]GGZ97225.1 enoyl-CoA hydratase [Novosphingobium arvoryzae]